MEEGTNDREKKIGRGEDRKDEREIRREDDIKMISEKSRERERERPSPHLAVIFIQTGVQINCKKHHNN